MLLFYTTSGVYTKFGMVSLHAVLSLYINVKHGEKALEGVLTVKAGIDQIAFFVLPFGKAAVVKRLLASSMMNGTMP